MLINIDEVATGALVNALAVAGRRLATSATGRRGRDDLALARWAQTFQLTEYVPDLPPALTEQVAAIMRGDEVQAALQELLAVRLTDAPESDAARVRAVFELTLPGPELARALFDYYDEQIGGIVARVEAADPQVLGQIRRDAFSARMIAITGAIERHTAALTARPDPGAEGRFLSSYRRHVTDVHGKLSPPDFDRRRRIPISDIYVPARIFHSEQAVASRPVHTAEHWETDGHVLDLPVLLDRTVLLGDPGGGKTTAANVLMHHFANSTGQIPFLVTLREYAAQDPPERSVADHIEHTLATFYQCPAPPGLVGMLLLTGRATVIFDGLDELLDTSRRAEVATRVEQFCAEYPLAPVLVTSRLIGYDQARLDDSQFTCFRLGGFDEEQVRDYAGKWFALDEDARPGDAEAFVADSKGIADLCANPLMLALLCILYRGEGSLPRDRAGVYEKCADLLFRKWDARRRIHRDLRAGHLVEPALRHLAWWLFTRDDPQSAVTERDLITETATFLRGRGFESDDDARAAAAEFVEFCRGRMWVFSEVGTTASGENLYAFTHRTFLEYFAAAWLAYDCGDPERLARRLAPRIAREEWPVVAELAVQIKDHTSNDGASRVYATLLGERIKRSAKGRMALLGFLATCLRSVDPSPEHVRELTRQIMRGALAVREPVSPDGLTGLVNVRDPWESTVGLLIPPRDHPLTTVMDEVDIAVSDVIGSGDQAAQVRALRVAMPGNPELRDAFVHRHSAAVLAAAQTDAFIRHAALYHGVIIVAQALDMPGGLNMLCRQPFGLRFGWVPFLSRRANDILHGQSALERPEVTADLTAVGEYLIKRPGLPWLTEAKGWHFFAEEYDDAPLRLTPTAFLAAAALLSIVFENNELGSQYEGSASPSVMLRELHPYFARRGGHDPGAALPDLPVPGQFQQIFRDWADRRVNFIASTETRARR